jgi:hypothetical protein
MMKAKRKTTAPEGAAKTEPAVTSEESGPMVTVLKTAQAEKLSPRGDGRLTYQVGRVDETVVLRISGNESSGRFSKEWVTAESIRKSLAQLPKNAETFKGALALRTAWKGQSSCNSGFGAAILKAEGVFVAHEDPKKKGMLTLSSPDALGDWEKAVLAMDVAKDAERVPLDPPKPESPFKKKDAPKPDASADSAVAEGSDPESGAEA